MKKGTTLITEKRESHIKKGFNYEHDTQHEVIDFLDAAYAYMYKKEAAWPFSDGFKLSDDIENLVNAGSMIAAAIDFQQGFDSATEVDDEENARAEKINELQRIIEYAADELGWEVSYLKKVAIAWAKDDPLTNTDFRDTNT